MRFICLLLITVSLASCMSLKKSSFRTGMKLLWSDEFNYNGLPDSNKWSYEVGGNGWGNNELEYYTEKDTLNAIVAEGVLKIIARKQTIEKSLYTSARLVTKKMFDFKYGRIEVSVKLPKSAGTWPAVWMLGNNIDKVGWPACGEIDIMEHRGTQLDTVFGALHYPGRFGGNANVSTVHIPTATTAFHKYTLEWNENSIKFFVDNKLFHSVDTDISMPYNQPFYILLNLAMGGNFGGNVDPLFEMDAMEIEYIRVFQ
jgi:beta-glucanase (GH16 family)